MELDDEEVGVENSIYKMSEAADWEKIDKHNLPDNNNNGRPIKPIPWTGGDKEFSLKVTDVEIESFKNGFRAGGPHEWPACMCGPQNGPRRTALF